MYKKTYIKVRSVENIAFIGHNMKDSEKLVITHEGALDNAYQLMKHMLSENGFLKVQVTAGNRTLSQNSLYWVWMAQLAEEVNRRNKTDFLPEEMHIRMKHQFLGYDTGKQIGSITVPPQLLSTAKLSKGDMYHYMSQIDAYCIDLGIYLVTPSDSVYATLKAKNESGQ